MLWCSSLKNSPDLFEYLHVWQMLMFLHKIFDSHYLINSGLSLINDKPLNSTLLIRQSLQWFGATYWQYCWTWLKVQNLKDGGLQTGNAYFPAYRRDNSFNGINMNLSFKHPTRWVWILYGLSCNKKSKMAASKLLYCLEVRLWGHHLGFLYPHSVHTTLIPCVTLQWFGIKDTSLIIVISKCVQMNQ